MTAQIGKHTNMKTLNKRISKSQAQLIIAHQERMQRAVEDLNLVMKSVAAGVSIPEGYRLESVSLTPPQLVFTNVSQEPNDES